MLERAAFLADTPPSSFCMMARNTGQKGRIHQGREPGDIAPVMAATSVEEMIALEPGGLLHVYQPRQQYLLLDEVRLAREVPAGTHNLAELLFRLEGARTRRETILRLLALKFGEREGRAEALEALSDAALDQLESGLLTADDETSLFTPRTPASTE